MRQVHRLRRVLPLLTGLLLLAGCADGLRMGLPMTQPALLDDSIILADGTPVALSRWSPENPHPPRAVVLALHGYNDYANGFDKAAQFWAGQGIATYAYDQRGFGRNAGAGLWSSTEALSSDAAAVLRLLRDRYPETPLYLLGHSMGGAVAITVVTGTGSPGLTLPALEGVILEAPAVWARRTMPGYQRLALDLAARLVPALTVSPEGLDIVPSDNVEMLRALSADPFVLKETRVDTLQGLVDLMDRAYEAAPELPENTLMLYGDREEVIPLGTVESMLTRIEPGRFTIGFYGDGYHMLLRDLQATIVWQDIAAWIESGGGPLPSGADQRGHERHLSAIQDEDDTTTTGVDRSAGLGQDKGDD